MACFYLKLVVKMNFTDEDETQALAKSYPERRRKFSNIIQLIVFVLVTCTLLAASVFAFQTCMPSRFYRGFDSWGNVCGGDSNTLTSINNLEGSGQLKTESKYVWQLNLVGNVPNLTGDKNNCSTDFTHLVKTASVKVCTNVCPNNSLILSNATNYKSILQENGYQQRNGEAYHVVAKLQKVEQSCKILPNSSHFSFVDIFGRCLPDRLLRNGYVLIPGYLNIWHYVAADILVSGSAITGSVLAMMATSVITSILSIKWPKHALTGCLLGSSGGALLCAAFNTLKVYSYADDTTKVMVVNDSKFLCVLLSAISVLVAVVALQKWWVYRRYLFGARGLMVEMSKCLHSLPKLLSVPLCTLFATVICSIYFLSVGLYLLNCHLLQVSKSDQLVEYITPSITIFEVVSLIGIIVVNIWFLNILRTFQQATIAGAVAQWYFAKKKNQVLHPITNSFRLCLQYNMGSVVACAFNSWFLRRMLRSGGKNNKIGGTNDEPVNNDQHEPSTWKCCVSPYAPACLGVYGYLRTTCLCDFRNDLSWNRRCTINQQFTNQKQQSSNALRFEEEGLVRVLRSSSYAAKSSIQILLSFLVCATLSTFLAASTYNTLYVRLFPFALTLCISYIVCDICLSVTVTTLDTISICFFEDVTRNDGLATPLYSSRGLLYHITGLKLPETSTFASILRRKRKELQLQSQLQKELEQRQRDQEIFERIRMKPRNVKMREQRIQMPKRNSTPLPGQKRNAKVKKATRQIQPKRLQSTPAPNQRLAKPIPRVSRNSDARHMEKLHYKPSRVIRTVRHPDDEELDSDEADDDSYRAKIWRESFW